MLNDLHPSLLAALRAHGAVDIRRLAPGDTVMPGETVETDASHHGHYSSIAWKPAPKRMAGGKG